MAAIFRTTVCGTYGGIQIYRDEGQTVLVDGEVFVRMQHGTIIPADAKWAPTQDAADRIALPELERWAAMLTLEITAIKSRPLPAAAAAHDTAAGRAHAGVAT